VSELGSARRSPTGPPSSPPTATSSSGPTGCARSCGTPLRDRFGTTAEEHGSRFVWFGTDLAFEVFTFIFRPTEHGLFQVHAYPFDGSTSTFIVECTEQTWRNAGLDEMSEEESSRSAPTCSPTTSARTTC
jgi:hypothetical protein